jgi:hypothetical protein
MANTQSPGRTRTRWESEGKCSIKVRRVRMNSGERAHLEKERKVRRRFCQLTNHRHGNAMDDDS